MSLAQIGRVNKFHTAFRTQGTNAIAHRLSTSELEVGRIRFKQDINKFGTLDSIQDIPEIVANALVIGTRSLTEKQALPQLDIEVLAPIVGDTATVLADLRAVSQDVYVSQDQTMVVIHELHDTDFALLTDKVQHDGLGRPQHARIFGSFRTSDVLLAAGYDSVTLSAERFASHPTFSLLT